MRIRMRNRATPFCPPERSSRLHIMPKSVTWLSFALRAARPLVIVIALLCAAFETATLFAGIPAASVRQLKPTVTAIAVNPLPVLPTPSPTAPSALAPDSVQATPELSFTEPFSAPVAGPTAIVSVSSAACEQPSGQLITETVPSKISAVEMYAHVFLPPCYTAARKYPVLYLIHGTAFEFGGWVNNGVPRVSDIRMSLGLLPHFIIVMPSADMRAGRAGKYSWTNGGKGSYGDFFVNELVPHIDGKYSTRAERGGRAIGGISRGGYWAIQIAMSNPDKFATLGAHSPSITSKLVGVPANFSMLSFAKPREVVKQFRVWMDAGDRDWARFDIDKFSKDLKAAGAAEFAYSVGQGQHEDAYWASRIGEYLAFYSADWK
jgi:enterochelin esterase-like enzyme